MRTAFHSLTDWNASITRCTDSSRLVNQWIGRTSQNKTLNFTAPQEVVPEVGSYIAVVTTGSFPNSLLGEMVI